ncbi:glycosyl transferase 2 family protein [Mycobacterium kansasii 824]|nr:glycosyl transferase 2 family protein [Mycobacterium kansasii 824]
MTSHYSDVWIVIPAFNEAAVIGDVIADVRSVFDHVVCVDDGSTDGTGDIALRAGAHLVRHPVNLGRAQPSRPASSTPAASPALRCSPRSTPTASTASRTWPP